MTTGDSRRICTSSPWVLIFYYKMTKEEQGSRCICVLGPRCVFFFFFLLSFFLLLTNNLCLVHFYRNHDDHDNDQPPSSWLKWGTGQGTTRAQDTTCLEPLVCFFFFFFFLFQNFNSFFFTKCLSFKRSTNGHYQQNKCGLETQMHFKFWYVIFFLSFFLY